MAEAALNIDYAEHEQVKEIIDVIKYCAEGISLEFEHWGETYARGPGLYFVLVSGHSVAGYADPMGANRWPVEECRTASTDLDSFFGAAKDVAFECDGAVVVSADGAILEQMVRLKDLSEEDVASLEDREDIEYADWMGARHMSAVDTSIREEVIAAITLSEEDGRVTVFRDGTFEDQQRESIAASWRAGE